MNLSINPYKTFLESGFSSFYMPKREFISQIVAIYFETDDHD